MKKLFFAFIFLMTAAHLFAIPGDLNDDGRTDIADLAMFSAMYEQRLAKTIAADLNFDGKVDAVDMDLLVSNIIYGTPLPEKLASETFYFSGQPVSISGGGLTINMGSFTETTTVSLSTMATPPDLDWDLDNCSMTPPVFVNGLPGRPTLYNASFTLDVPPTHNDKAGKPMLLLGFYGKSPHQPELQWNYRALPAEEEFDITYADGKLTWTPNYSTTYDMESVPFCMAVLYSTRTMRSEPETTTPPQTRADGFQFEKVNYLYGYGIYRTKHFCIELHTSVPETQVKALAVELEESYREIGALGMSQDFGSKWVSAKRIWVNINKNPLNWKLQRVKSDTACCNAPSMLKAPYLDVPEGAMDSKQRAEICCHELFHYHQYYYAVHATAMFLDEMVGTWSEYLVTVNPNDYLPDNYVQPRAVINGLYRPSWAESKISGKHYAGEHGYSLVPFARWLTEVKYPGKNLWSAVFSSRLYERGDGIRALQNGIKEMDSTDTLATLYPQFMRDYFDGMPDIPQKVDPRCLFTQMGMDGPEAVIDRFAETGMLTTIKAAADMFKEENQKHTFKIQNYGAATWRYMFMQPKDYLKDYTSAVVTFSLPENSDEFISNYTFFAVIYDGVKTTLTEWEAVTVNTEKNTAQLIIPLEDLAPDDRNVTYFGLVAVAANDEKSADYQQSLTMKVDFMGPIVLNGLVTWKCDYLGYQEAKAFGNMTLTPINDTIFVGAERDILGGDDVARIPYVETRLGGEKRPNEIIFNITSIIQDATATIENPSELFRTEFTGKVNIQISRTRDNNQAEGAQWDELIFDGQDYNPVSSEQFHPLMGRGTSISDLQPVAPGKKSNFFLRIENIAQDIADGYTHYHVSISLPYFLYEEGQTVTTDFNEVIILILNIDL